MQNAQIISQEELKERFGKVYAPTSVYRLQFNAFFGFKKAIQIIPYLKALGVEAIYASSFLESARGSAHGYDVANPNQINPEIGTSEDFEAFHQELEKNGMKLILDIVPNHMGIKCNQNMWWLDVLENGPISIYADVFDIDWRSIKSELADKVLLPVLEDHYGTVVESGKITLKYLNKKFIFQYFEYEFPLDPKSYPQILNFKKDDLTKKLDANDKDFLEYESVINAFNLLPSKNEIDPKKAKLRNREKEIAKERLFNLTERSEIIKRFVENNIQTFNGNPEDPKSFDLIDALLSEQNYRLAFWRVASEEINYRRFFNINELAAIQIHKKEVFEMYHAFIFELVRSGKIHGFRIDHPDGLYDPVGYFRNIQRYYLKQVVSEQEIGELEEELIKMKPFFVVVEKILDKNEKLPEEWGVHGTVGYDFLNSLNGLFVKRENEKLMSEIYESFIGETIDFNEIVYQKKKFIALIQMSSEINSLGYRLDKISERNRRYRDFTRNNLTLAIRETIASFPVYRTYISPGDQKISDADRKYVEIAIEKARHRTPNLNPSVYDFLKRILLLELMNELGEEDKQLYQDFILRFQQLTGPIMAKGFEDTALYIYNRLISLNEVGGNPTRFGSGPEDFHKQNSERNSLWPYSFLATSTHDTKRGYDVRMRINALSELPKDWKALVERLSIYNSKHKTMIENKLEPDRNMEYYIYQTLIGTWPPEGLTEENQPDYKIKIEEHALKAAREAMVQTSWISPNPQYEEALKKFLDGILSLESDGAFLELFIPFHKRIAALGALNSLSGIVLKLGSPGIVDTYQGAELWNLFLVDPDNRRLVDFEERQRLITEMNDEMSRYVSRELFAAELAAKTDGRLKMYLLKEGQNFRQKYSQLFLGANYVPLEVVGERSKHVTAFMRKKEGEWVVIAAGRFFDDFLDPENEFNFEMWEGTYLVCSEFKGSEIREILTGKKIEITEVDGKSAVLLSKIFGPLNVAIFSNTETI